MLKNRMFKIGVYDVIAIAVCTVVASVGSLYIYHAPASAVLGRDLTILTQIFWYSGVAFAALSFLQALTRRYHPNTTKLEIAGGALFRMLVSLLTLKAVIATVCYQSSAFEAIVANCKANPVLVVLGFMAFLCAKAALNLAGGIGASAAQLYSDSTAPEVRWRVASIVREGEGKSAVAPERREVKLEDVVGRRGGDKKI